MNPRAAQLASLLERSGGERKVVSAALEGTPHLFVKVAMRGREAMLIVWDESESTVNATVAEEIGEDAGFYDPRAEAWTCHESAHATLIREGYRGSLCQHQWGMTVHADARDETADTRQCSLCGVRSSVVRSRWGRQVRFTYGSWVLRPHVYRYWCWRGPSPSELTIHPHHLHHET